MPAAISDVRIHALRSIALPIFLVVLAVPALSALREHLDVRTARVAALAVALLAAGQATLFAVQYSDRGPGRLESFHADFRPVMRAALATGSGPVAVYEADPDALGNATWYGRLWNEPVNVLMEGESPAPGSAVVAVTKGCEACEQIATRGLFTAFIAR